MSFFCSGEKREKLYRCLRIDSNYTILFYPPPIRSDYGIFHTVCYIPSDKPVIYARIKLEFTSKVEVKMNFGCPNIKDQDIISASEHEIRVVSSVINTETLEVYRHACKCIETNVSALESISYVFHHPTYKNSLVVVALGIHTPNEHDDTASQTLTHQLGSLLKSKIHSDVTISSQGKCFNVHRAVLAARSPVFAAMFKHDTQAKQEHEITIDDVDQKTMSSFLRYLYTDEADDLTIDTAQRLFIVADKYCIQKLRAKCVDFMRKNMTTDVALQLLCLAELHSEENLKNTALRLISKNFAAVTKSKEWNELVRNNPTLAEETKTFCTTATKSVS